MTLHDKLKLSTKNLHDQIESYTLFQKIITQTITLEEYKLLLKKFYGFIKPYESVLSQASLQSMIAGREKIVLLKKDLNFLGMDDSDLSTILECELPSDTSKENLLGYLYVIEGSTLGGQLISRALKNHLCLSSEQGLSFFYGYGNLTKTQWDNFCTALNAIDDLTQQKKVIEAALFTYNRFYSWLLIS